MVLHQHLSDDKKFVEFGKWSGGCGKEYWEVFFKVPVTLTESQGIHYAFVDNGQLGGGNCIGELRKNVFYPKFNIIND